MTASPEMQRQMLRRMQTIRRFEELASDDYQSGDIYGVVHCYIGEEAVAVAPQALRRRRKGRLSSTGLEAREVAREAESGHRRSLRE